MQKVPDDHNPFGPSQTRLFKYILSHPGCTAADIRENEFTDRDSRYVSNLIYENRNLIEKRDIGDGIPNEYRMMITNLGTFIDVQHYVKTGAFKGKYKQPELPLKQPATKNGTGTQNPSN